MADVKLPLPIFFDQCEAHSAMEAKLMRIESQQDELYKSVLQGQRDTNTRFGDIDRKMDRQHERTTGEIIGLRKAVLAATLSHARANGIADGRAEVTGEINTKVQTAAKVAKWIAGVIVALAAGGGTVEGIRRLLGG